MRRLMHALLALPSCLSRGQGCGSICGGIGKDAANARRPTSKAPDPAIRNQTRGTPYAARTFSRASGRTANAKYRF